MTKTFLSRVLALAIVFSMVSSNGGFLQILTAQSVTPKIDICHSTGAGTYNKISVSQDATVEGHDSDNDIIPSFTYFINEQTGETCITDIDKPAVTADGPDTYEKSEDFNGTEVIIDFKSSDKEITINPVGDYYITKVELDVENDSHSGFYDYTSHFPGAFNPNPGGDINSAKVTVKRDAAPAITHQHCTPIYENVEHTYVGKNWDSTGQTIWNNNCVIPPVCTDNDSDGYGQAGSTGCSNVGTDCNDSDPTVYPGSTETCNNKDDDCDGSIDEFVTRPTNCGLGICFGNTGIETCTAGAWGGNTCDPLAGVTAEICDGASDDDCDGTVDNGCSCTNGISEPCGSSIVGKCQKGTKTCSGGVWGSCVGSIEPITEICNNSDDDCDGTVDNGFTNKGQTCTSGVGACQATGSYVCSESGLGTECNAVAGTPGTETCNGLDDDCDGTVDEGCSVPTANINASKIICNNETDLPNWGAGSGIDYPETVIGPGTVSSWIQSHQNCRLASNWQFEWKYGSDSSWTSFGPTDSNGVATAQITVPQSDRIDLREVEQTGYIPFSGSTGAPYNDVSAEFYCHDDILNYDNLEYLYDNGAQQTPIVAGNTYYCVAFNVSTGQEPQCTSTSECTNNGTVCDGINECRDGRCVDSGPLQCTYGCDPINGCNPTPTCVAGLNILKNGSFETPLVTDKVNWQLFPSGTDLLEWIVGWVGTTPSDPPKIEIQKGVVIAPSEGLQSIELDSEAPTYISQSVSTLSGSNYKLTFDFAARPTTPEGDNRVEVWVNGALKDTVESVNTWTTKDYTFAATGNTTEIKFVDVGVPNDDKMGTLLDNVKLECVPETLTGSIAGYKVNDLDLDGTYDGAHDSSPDEAFGMTGWKIYLDLDHDEVFDEQEPSKLTDGTGFYRFEGVNNGTYQICEVMQSGWGSAYPLCKTITVESDVNQQFDHEARADFYNYKTGTITGYKYNDLDKDGEWDAQEPGLGGWNVFIDFNDNGINDGNDWQTTTDGNAGGLYTFVLVPVGTYDICEINHLGWTSHNTLCQEITVEDGVTSTADFFNYALGWSEWGTCSVTCGGGTQTRTCAEGAQCEGPLSQACNTQSCGGGQSPTYTGNDGTTGGGTPPPPVVAGVTTESTEPTGEVLGASAETCDPYLIGYIKLGANNNPEEVTKLQHFLNEYLGLNLPVDGIYSQDDYNAVATFQLTFKDDILKPWADLGLLSGSDDPTGYVYRTTQRKINLIVCPGLGLIMPDLTDEIGRLGGLGASGSVLGESTEAITTTTSTTVTTATTKPEEEVLGAAEGTGGKNRNWFLGFMGLLIIGGGLYALVLRKKK